MDKILIDLDVVTELIDTLQTSKNYHLGITALDSEEEIEFKCKSRETALIRRINSTLKHAKNAIASTSKPT